MKVGTICFATEQGLGFLAKSFYDNGVVTDVTVMHHPSYKNFNEKWYPNSPVIRSAAPTKKLSNFIASMDVMLFFETPFNWKLFPLCKELGTKVVLMPMYECTPDPIPFEPDLYLCPSKLDLAHFPKHSIHVPVPVDEKWQLRTTAKTFLHNAGHFGLRERNGTRELLKAVKYIESDLKLVIRAQDTKLFRMAKEEGVSTDKYPNVTISVESVPHEHLFSLADVYVAPEKFNGLSLPLQEARASGLLVMATDRFPTNDWLPTECLIYPEEFTVGSIAGFLTTFDMATVNPKTIAKTMDDWYGRDITEYSKSGRVWAETMSWRWLKHQYTEVLQKLSGYISV